MKIDLKSLSIDEIRVFGNLDLNNDYIQQIRTASPPDKDGDSVFWDVSTEKNNKYSIILIISPIKKDSTVHKLSLHCHRGKVSKKTKTTPLIEEALGILSHIDKSVEFTCFVGFVFAKRDKVKPLINLPLILSTSSILPFSEVRGFHLAKLKDKKSIYDVILDLDTHGTINETIFFKDEIKIKDSLVNDLINKATEISERFVTREK